MLAILPFLVLLAGFMLAYGWLLRRGASDGSLALVYSVTAWGAYLALVSELLGQFGAIRFDALLAAWGLPLLALLAIGWKTRWLAEGAVALWRQIWQMTLTCGEIGLTAGAGGIVLALLVIVCVAPPNNNDSLMYHLPRVAHWAQNGALAHYPAAYVFQLSNAIWAELVILHTYVLSGGDGWANLVAWAGMLGSLILAAATARQLGAARRGQVLAVVFAVSLPMGILQATNAQNDGVAAFWLLALAYLAVKNDNAARGGAFSWNDILASAGILGLGTLTKGTFPFYAWPFALWILISVGRCISWRKAFVTAVLFGIIGVGLNLGFWWRNDRTFDAISGPKSWMTNKTLGTYTPGALLANLARNVSLQWGTPFDAVNEKLAGGVVELCKALGQPECIALRDTDQYTYRIPLLSNHEDSAGNPLHLLLIAGSIAILLALKDADQRRLAGRFALAAVLALATFGSIVLWELYGSRYQLPFFVVCAPLFGLAVESLGRKRLAYGLGVFLLLAALPWVLFNRTRPLIGWTPRITAIPSIFQDDRRGLLFANHPEFREPYLLTSKAFLSSGCTQLGLILDSRDAEYPFWTLTNHMNNGIHIEVIGGYPPELERYANPAFAPCAAICTTCGDNPAAAGLPLAYRSHGMTLYLSRDYQFLPPP